MVWRSRPPNIPGPPLPPPVIDFFRSAHLGTVSPPAASNLRTPHAHTSTHISGARGFSRGAAARRAHRSGRDREERAAVLRALSSFELYARTPVAGAFRLRSGRAGQAGGRGLP